MSNNNSDADQEQESEVAVVEHHDIWTTIAGVAGNMLEVRTSDVQET